VAVKIRSALTEGRLDKIVVTAPLLPALTWMDLNDAVENAGLQSWLVDFMSFPKTFSELRAQYAGQGEGPCESFRDMFHQEERDEEVVYLVQCVSQVYKSPVYSTNLDL
jgi:hypothetical protein